MARAAVKAKQQARAKAQPAKPVRGSGRRRHSGGGNPNQNLFFMKLRRRQKWVFVLLAVVFAVTFAGVGVGSGAGSGGLDQLYSGIFGGGGNAVSKAKAEIKNNPKSPAKGYTDLAAAYETAGNNGSAISALRQYLKLKPKDANVWGELGGLQMSQGQTYATRYQQAQQAAQLADPSQPFQPGGTLGQALGPNPVYSTAAQAATSQVTQLFQQATKALNGAVSAYQKAAKLQPRSAPAQQSLAQAAENAGQTTVALAAWKRYKHLDPNSPILGQVNARIKQLETALKPAKSSTSVSAKSSSGKK